MWIVKVAGYKEQRLCQTKTEVMEAVKALLNMDVNVDIVIKVVPDYARR